MSTICTILFLLSYSQVVLLHYFTVSFNDYILLHQNYSGITAVAQDLDGNFLVGFLDGTAKKYTADFSTYSIITVPGIVNAFDVSEMVLAVQLSNGSFINMNSRKTIITFDSFTTIRDYNYYGYTLDETFNINSAIIQQLGLPLTVSSVSHTYHIVVCNDSVTLAYMGNKVAYNFATYFGITGVCQAAVFDSFSTSPSIDSFSASHRFYISISTNIYLLTVQLPFQFDATANHFSLLFSLSSLTLNFMYSPSDTITYMSIANGLLLMQSNTTGLAYLYDPAGVSGGGGGGGGTGGLPPLGAPTVAVGGAIGTTSGISTDQIFTFFYVHGGYYLLQSTGISQFIYDSTSYNLYLSYIVVSLPYNQYHVILGSPINAFYIPGQPYMLKAGLCPGQDYMRLSDEVCISFGCTGSNCSWCPFSASMCSVCDTGFVSDINYTCHSNITNTTIPANTTNITNTTIPNNTQTIQVYYSQQSFLQKLLQILISLLKYLISVPMARRVVSPTFYFFGIFDDIYLFQFHDRLYGATMTTIFDNLNDIQQKKWSILNYQVVLDWINVSSNWFRMTTDYQDSYDNFSFTDADHPQMSTEGIWANCQNFFLVSLPITLIVFVFGKVLFRIFFNWRVSKIFRRFDFWSLLILLLLDGNVQQFSFYLATDWKNMFFFSLSSKMVKFQIVWFGFVFIVACTGLYFVSYSFYQKSNKYIMDNNKNNIKGQTGLILQFGLRNFYLGLMNSYLRVLTYKHMLSVLFVSEIVLVSFFITSLSMKIYESSSKMCIYILLNFAKILLMITLFLDYLNINLPVIEMVQQTLVIIEIILFVIGSLLQTFLTLKDLWQFGKRILNLKKEKTKYLKKQLSKKGISIYVDNIEEIQVQRDRKRKKTFKLRKYNTFQKSIRFKKNTKNMNNL